VAPRRISGGEMTPYMAVFFYLAWALEGSRRVF